MLPSVSINSLTNDFADFTLITRSERIVKLQTLLKMPWKEHIGKDLARQHPEGYARDILRCTLHVGDDSFICGDAASSLQEIDNAMLSLINALCSCPLANVTKGVHLIRYLTQELFTANLFVLDPEFPAIYNEESYLPKGQLLFPLKETPGGKESHVSLTSKESTLILKAVQYWQVGYAKNPKNITGYDALRIEIAINLDNATEETVLSCFESAECRLQFHGHCATLAKIDF